MGEHFENGEAVVKRYEGTLPKLVHHVGCALGCTIEQRENPGTTLGVVRNGFANPFAMAGEGCAVRRKDQFDIQALQFPQRVEKFSQRITVRQPADVGRNLLEYLRAAYPEALPKVRFLKIDTEGFDRTVVETLAPLLKTSRPYLKTEIYKHLSDEERSAYFDDLRALGYLCFKCGDVELQGEPLRRHSDLSKWRHFDVFAVPEEFGAVR